jgi:hypothetical protein
VQVQFALTFPVAMLDGIAYWWIFVALSSLMTQVQMISISNSIVSIDFFY